MAYIIQRGDTLSQIAKKNNTTVQEIAALNNISDPNKIRAGASLSLPGAAAATPGAGALGAAPQTVPLSNQDVLRQYTDFLNQPFNAGGVAAGFNSAASSMQSAVQQAKQLAQTQADAQKKALQQQYEDVRKQTYVNSRLGALGNNEALASIGLAGNAYESPQSGYSESCRVAQVVALRSNISCATRQEQAQIDALAQMIIEQGITADIEYARWLADMQIQQANAIETARQQDHQNKLNILGQIVGTNQQEFNNQQALLKSQPQGRKSGSPPPPTDPYAQWDSFVSALSDGQKFSLFSGAGAQEQAILSSMRNDLGSGFVQALQNQYGAARYWKPPVGTPKPAPNPWGSTSLPARTNQNS